MQAFQEQLRPLTDTIAAATVDKALEQQLNQRFPSDGPFFREVEAACHKAIAEGLMCTQGQEGRRFGRIIEPSSATGNLSIDVVELDSMAGPHHMHPTGEICMIMPQDREATFDGHGAGWCVNPPGSGHFPTVEGGKALILYLLPGGKIDFTGRSAQ